MLISGFVLAEDADEIVTHDLYEFKLLIRYDKVFLECSLGIFAHFLHITFLVVACSFVGPFYFNRNYVCSLPAFWHICILKEYVCAYVKEFYSY